MGLLEKLWDDTMAGPQPDSGLGKLRKHNTFSFRSYSGGKEPNGVSGNERSYSEEAQASENPVKITRSITIVRPPGYSGSAPGSPAGTTPPPSPFSDVTFVNQGRHVMHTSVTYEDISAQNQVNGENLYSQMEDCSYCTYK